jgi:hypothetical protein
MSKSSVDAPPPAGLADDPKLKAIFRWPSSAETERERPFRGERGLGALNRGEVGGVEENERWWSDEGLRLKRVKVRARILRQLLSVERRRKKKVARKKSP